MGSLLIRHKSVTEKAPAVWRGLLYGLWAALIVMTPVLKGLFFAAEFLPVLLLISLLFIVQVVRRDIICRISKFGLIDGAIVLLIMLYVLSLFSAIVPRAALVEVFKVVSYGMIYLLAIELVRGGSGIRWLAQSIYAAGILLAVIGLGAALDWIPFPAAFVDGHIRSSLQYHNATAIYLAAACLIGMGLAFTARNKRQKLAYLAGIYLLGITVLGTLSRATWLLLPLFLLVYSGVVPRNKRKNVIAAVLIVGVAILIAGRVVQNAYMAGQSIVAVLALLAGLAALIPLIIAFTLPEDGQTDNEQPNGVSIHFSAWRWLTHYKYCLVTAGLFILIALYGVGLTIHHPTAPAGYLFADRTIARANLTFTDSTSPMERIISYQDAVRIIRDYPLTGTGGGGWEALYHSYADQLYWVNEMHNYYLKVAIETGIPGFVVVLGIGILFLRLVYKNRGSIASREDSSLIWAIILAIIIIAVHSGMDFDLSFPAIAFAFFALMGAVRATLIPPPAVKMIKRGLTPFFHFLIGGIAVLSIVTVFVLAAGMYVGQVLGEKGAEALAAKQLGSAQVYYERAAVVDFWNPGHQANLARISALQVMQDQDGSKYDLAIRYAQCTTELGGRQQDLQASLFSTFGLLGRPDLQAEAVEQAIKSNPFIPGSYRMLAVLGMDSAWRSLDMGDYKQANTYLDKILTARKQLPPYLYGKIPELELAAGQAALLRADTALAQRYLEPITYYRGTNGKTARVWLAGADHMSALIMKSGLSADNQLLYLKQLQQFLAGEV